MLAAIIANVKRLVEDARVLQGSGSAGSALALAILAFEEGGKGHIVEHEWRKPKTIRSHHIFRHQMAFMVLNASLSQKYGFDLSEAHSKIAQRFAEAGVKPASGVPLPSMTQQLREALRAELLPQLVSLSEEQLSNFGTEHRWLEKIAAAVHNGQLERIRQSGFYVDTDDRLEIASSPMAIQVIETERWIWAATRVLNLLEGGECQQPYSPLSELMAAAQQGNPEARKGLSMVGNYS